MVYSDSVLPNENSQVTEPDDKELQELNYIVNELIETEIAYVNDMDKIYNGYNEVLKLYQCPKTKKCFTALVEVLKIGKLLVRRLQLAKDSPIKIGRIFDTMTGNFKKIYGNYCSSYPDASIELHSMVTHEEFTQALADKQLELDHRLSLESYLLKPIQRIMKYPLLLKSMTKLKLWDEENHNILIKAYQGMMQVSDFINEKKREVEGISLIAHFNFSIINLKTPLTVENVGPVQLHNEFEKGHKKMTVILCTKVLMLTRPQGENLTLYKTYPISDLILIENPPKSITCFELISYSKKKKIATFDAKKKDLKDQWITHLKALIIKNMPISFDDGLLSAMLGEKVGSHVSTILSAKSDAIKPYDSVKSLKTTKRTDFIFLTNNSQLNLISNTNSDLPQMLPNEQNNKNNNDQMCINSYDNKIEKPKKLSCYDDCLIRQNYKLSTVGKYSSNFLQNNNDINYKKLQRSSRNSISYKPTSPTSDFSTRVSESLEIRFRQLLDHNNNNNIKLKPSTVHKSKSLSVADNLLTKKLAELQQKVDVPLKISNLSRLSSSKNSRSDTCNEENFIG